MISTPKIDVKVKKYIYSIFIDLAIFSLLIIGFVLLHDTITNSFGNFGNYLYWIYLVLAVVFHAISDTMFRHQSIGKKLMKICIQNKSGKKAHIYNLVLQRIVELPILILAKKQSYFEKILNITNNVIIEIDR